MTDPIWIDSDVACALLHVRKQTLYAYVSRGLIRACSDREDPRRSLYARADVDMLAAQNRRPRARAAVAQNAIRWGDPVLATAISGVREGTLYFGTEKAADLAGHMTLEDVFCHHCRVTQVDWPDTSGPAERNAPALQRMLIRLAEWPGQAVALQNRARSDIAQEGAQVLMILAAEAFGSSRSAPIHEMAAGYWGAAPSAADLIRKALVLMSDHELNPSTFAVRICASTGAGLSACLSAGLATLSGTRHGGVANKARDALRAGERGARAIRTFEADNPGLAPFAFGFGHPLYPQGDPRAQRLLAELGVDDPAVQAVSTLSQHLKTPPNIDAALAALSQSLDLPRDAAFLIFAVGRLIGWIAHAIEQAESHQIIRPRAQFAPAKGKIG